MVLPREQQVVLAEDELLDIIGILLSFSGIEIHAAQYWSASEVKKRFSVEEWGTGMHGTLKCVASRSFALGVEVSSWVHQHFDSLEADEEAHYPQRMDVSDS